MEALGLNLGYLLVQIFNFAIIFVVLRVWVYKPVLGMLEKRREAVAKGLDDAREAADARANAEKEADRIIGEAQVKAAELIREATERAETAAKQIQAEADADAARRREVFQAELEQERTRLLRELRSQVVSLAIAAAQKLIGVSLMDNKDRQQKLLQDFFSRVQGDKVVVLEGDVLKGTSVNVTSALPLTAEEQEAVKKDVLTDVSGKVVSAEGMTFSFHVDPSILGGLVVRVGDRVVDGSVAGQLQEMRQAL